MRCSFAVLAGLLFVLPAAAQPIAVPFGRGVQTTGQDPAEAEAKALEAAKLKPDDATALVAYFQSRTLSAAELERVRAVIRRMGDERFEERRLASDEAAKFGPGGITPLRAAAQSDPDPEVAFRAGEALKRIETVPHSTVASAAARRLGELAPPGAAAALLGFLPTADSNAVADDIRDVLLKLAAKGDKPDPAVVAALTDASPVRREAAVYALAPIAGVRSQVKAALAAEKDADARFRMAYTLATAGREADAVRSLIDQLPDLAPQRGRVWLAEDVLLQAAGDDRPKAAFGPDRAALERAKEAWLGWWDSRKGKEPFAQPFRARTTGRLLLLSADQVQWGNGKLVRLGPDGKPEWQVPAMAPADLHVTPGRVWLLEPNRNWVREWDERGNNLQNWPPQAGQPVGFQPLPTGALVAYPHMVAEYDAKWKEVRKFTRQANDIRAVAQLPGGPVYVLAGNQQQNTVIRLEAKDNTWEKLQKEQTTGPLSMQPRLGMVDRDRVLVTEQTRVVEYDFTKADQKAGEGAWQVPAANPLSVQRLPSGTTLVTDTNGLRELSPGKAAVWTYTPADRMKLTRAVRR